MYSRQLDVFCSLFWSRVAHQLHQYKCFWLNIVIRQLIIWCSFSSPDNSLPRTAELDPAQAGSVSCCSAVLWPIFRVTSLPKASTSTAFIYQCVCVSCLKVP